LTSVTLQATGSPPNTPAGAMPYLINDAFMTLGSYRTR
jgi:hypothetical protein